MKFVKFDEARAEILMILCMYGYEHYLPDPVAISSGVYILVAVIYAAEKIHLYSAS